MKGAGLFPFVWSQGNISQPQAFGLSLETVVNLPSTGLGWLAAWLAAVTGADETFSFVLHKLLSPTCIPKCQTPRWDGFSDLEIPIPTSQWCCKHSRALEELCPLRLLAAWKSESCFYDDSWLLAIWYLKGSVNIFCKNSAKSCYSVQGLREAFGTDIRTTLRGDLLSHHIEKGQTLGKLGLTQ